jgi:hypothetical protein
VVDANWKTDAVNFGADGPHAVKGHGPITAATFGMPLQTVPDSLLNSPAVSMDNGHNGILPLIPESLRDPLPNYPGHLADLVECSTQTLTTEQQAMSKHLIGGVQVMLPNLSSVQAPVIFNPEEPPG